MLPIAELKNNGKRNFKKNYWACVLVGLIAAITSGGSSLGGSRFSLNNVNQEGVGTEQISEFVSRPEIIGLIVGGVGIALIVGLAVGFFLLNVLEFGACRFFVKNQSEQASVGIVGDGFSGGKYSNIVKTLAIRDVKLFLWTLLLIIPGIIKGYEYMMVPYILAENPGMDQAEVFALSKRMMIGKKMDAFVLDLSFIGWFILGIFTCGILYIFYVNPYLYATHAEIYAFNKSEAYAEGYIR